MRSTNAWGKPPRQPPALLPCHAVQRLASGGSRRWGWRRARTRHGEGPWRPAAPFAAPP
jgi:hypothetical protein